MRSGALIYNGPLDENIKIDERELMIQIKQRKALFARYFTDSQFTPPITHSSASKEETNSDSICYWWHCLKDDEINLETLNSKQRYRIKKGLRLNEIHIADYKEVERNVDELSALLCDSFSDYPKIYKPKGGYNEMARSYIEYAKQERSDVWFVFDKQNLLLVGMAFCTVKGSGVGLKVVKVRPQFLNNEINAALGYEICRYYINEKKYRYICDGERNIRHITSYQDFLVRVLGFRKVPCKLHVIYHPIIKPIVNLMFPFRRIIATIGKHNKLLYNISCVLKQEEIARKYR